MKNYELKEDCKYYDSYPKRFYIRGEFPSCYITDNMTLKEAKKVAKCLQQLGNNVKDLTKGN